MIVFTAYGVPKGQPRARATIRGKHAGVYDPGTADGWKAIVVMAGRPHRPEAPLDGPLRVCIDLFFPRPKRLMRKSDPDEAIWMTSKPDRDNCEKAILDAMTQDGWWHDDAQVCDGLVRKFYVPKNGRPCAVICIYQL